MSRRTAVTGLLACVASVAALAQQPARPEKTFTNAADVAAMIAKAKKERKPDQGNFIQPLLSLAPYLVNLEYRVQGVDTPPNIHDAESEIVYVVEGAGVLTQGGRVLDEKRLNPNNRTGRVIEGGTPRRIVKGDYIFVPANTPHAFTKTEGSLVIMSIHLPKDGAGR